MRILIAAAVLQCAAAVWLIVSPPDQLPWLGITLLLLTLLVTGAVFYTLHVHRRRMHGLHDRVLSFLHEGKELPYSLTEDVYSEIENDIAEMAHRMLVQQETVAKENRKTLDFISDVSHQLKTPLTSLKLYCEMGDQQEKELVLIEHMEALIYSLLRLQKLEAGAYALRFASHDMAALIMDIVQELSILYPCKKFAVDIIPGSSRFDEYWMGEAIMNVLKNACEHTAESGSIGVVLTQTEQTVSITVQDDGGGVPAEELPLLFKRFYRASVQQGGTGLGLAITRSIVERHHGAISAQNGEKGLRIIICLPKLSGKLPVS